MIAVIMAAGMGTRFGQMTEKIPKGFIPYNGIPMVVRSIRTLIDCGIDRIIIGTGYKKEEYESLAKDYPQIECVFSPRYAETNSMYTLYNCRDAIGNNDFILLESDLVFEKKAITSLMECPYESAMLITPVTKFQDQYYVEMNDKCQLVNCSTDKTKINPSGELVGIHKIGSEFFRILVDEYDKIVQEKPKLGYEFQLLDVSKRIRPMNVLKVDGLQWYEIDDINDLDFAQKNVKI
jgi:choline kinase